MEMMTGFTAHSARYRRTPMDQKHAYMRCIMYERLMFDMCAACAAARMSHSFVMCGAHAQTLNAYHMCVHVCLCTVSNI